MKTFLLVALCGISAFAVQNVTVYVDNQPFQCTQGGVQPSDPNCIQKCAAWCDDNTSLTSTDCFNQAASACAGQQPGYSDCVISTAQYCDDNTSMTTSDCFKRSIAACKGQAGDIISLMRARK